MNRSVSGLGAGAVAPTEGVTRDEATGLTEMIEDMADAVRRAGTSVLVDLQIAAPSAVGQAASPSTRASMVAAAIVREGCTNALRHAPGSPIRIRARSERKMLVLEVVDTASGPAITSHADGDPATLVGRGQGLEGLAVQAEAIGGQISAGPDDHGWAVRAVVPADVVTGVDEAKHVLAGRRRRTRRLLVALPLVTVAAMVALPTAAVMGQATLSRISVEDFAAVAVGQQEKETRGQLPVMGMQSPPQQVGAGACEHYEATVSPFERTEVYEVCFINGRVSSTTIIPAA